MIVYPFEKRDILEPVSKSYIQLFYSLEVK